MRTAPAAEKLVLDSKLAVIPLYPIEPWNDKKEVPEDQRGMRAGRDAFKEVKLELRANPVAVDSFKYGCTLRFLIRVPRTVVSLA